jgi:hypothetical protein
MFIFPGIYMVKHLDYFEGAFGGSLSAEAADKVRLHIPRHANCDAKLTKFIRSSEVNSRYIHQSQPEPPMSLDMSTPFRRQFSPK